VDRFLARFLDGKPPGIPLFDSHGHLGRAHRDYPIFGAGADAVIREMDRLGICQAVVTPICVVGTEASYLNDLLIAECRKYPDRLAGFALVNLNWDYPAIEKELDRCLSEGLCGIKLIAHYQNYPDDGPKIEEVCAYAHRRQRVILNHWWHSPDFLRRMAMSFPQATLVQGHYPGAGWASALTAGDNVWFSTTNYFPFGSVEEMVRACRNDRIVWGSDVSDLQYGWGLGPVVCADIPEETKEKILSANGRELFRRIRGG